jgi:beta-glucosidase
MPISQVAASDCVFPDDFAWGTATAAYQIEGAAYEDGRGLSVWDAFCKRPGAVFEGHSGDVACDHYHRYREDVGLLRELGADVYRFSVSWPRVLPDGRGTPNEQGLAFYDRLVDELLGARVRPLCTLFHWDLPLALERRGGFRNRDIADWFAEYAALLGRRLGDRVELWVTQNEPQVYIGLGLHAGLHAPGLKLGFGETLLAAHNSLRAHGKAVAALRASTRRAQIGYVIAAQVARPEQPDGADLEAARTATFAVRDRTHFNNSWWTDPVLLGCYPDEGLSLFGAELPRLPASDFDDMGQPIDFIGLNIYKADTFRHSADGVPQAVPLAPGHPRSAVDWQPITPDSHYYGPRFFHERYGLPLFITESGLSTRDQLFLDGRVHDPQRIDYMHRSLLELRRAIADGADVRGYLAWSLLDNFEWADGYKQRFGLVYVDYGTQRRIPKDSFHWYKQVIATGGASLAGEFALPAHAMTPREKSTP